MTARAVPRPKTEPSNSDTGSAGAVVLGMHRAVSLCSDLVRSHLLCAHLLRAWPLVLVLLLSALPAVAGSGFGSRVGGDAAHEPGLASGKAAWAAVSMQGSAGLDTEEGFGLVAELAVAEIEEEKEEDGPAKGEGLLASIPIVPSFEFTSSEDCRFHRLADVPACGVPAWRDLPRGPPDRLSA